MKSIFNFSQDVRILPEISIAIISKFVMDHLARNEYRVYFRNVPSIKKHNGEHMAFDSLHTAEAFRVVPYNFKKGE